MLLEVPRLLANYFEDATGGIDALAADLPLDGDDAGPPPVGDRIYDETRDARAARGQIPKAMVEDGPAVVVAWLGDVGFDPKRYRGSGEEFRIAEGAQLAVRVALYDADTAAGLRDLYYLVRAVADSALKFFEADAATRTMNKVRCELAGAARFVPAHPLEDDGVIAAGVVLTVRCTFVAA